MHEKVWEVHVGFQLLVSPIFVADYLSSTSLYVVASTLREEMEVQIYDETFTNCNDCKIFSLHEGIVLGEDLNGYLLVAATTSGF
jgi:hypothetical protein